MGILRVVALSFVALTLAVVASFPSAARAGDAAPQEVQAVLSAKQPPAQLDVVGVVSKRDPAKGTFALIDRAEFAKCQSVGCAPGTLPVRWGGTMPKVGESVRVKGSVRNTKEGKFLVAESVGKAGK